jgi:uroporphyrinogen III methyltransferase/synthase
VRTTLGELDRVELEPPVTLVIGRVAGLELSWFENRPLFGRRVVVTRARQQASGLAERLRGLGAAVVELPTIEIVEPADGGAALVAAVAGGRVRDYDWIALTSANAVERLFARLSDARALGDVRVAVVGPATEAALRMRGVVADLVAAPATAESLAATFPTGSGRVLLPQAAIARPTLADGLRTKGWDVEVVEAYGTVAAAPSAEALAAAAKADAVTFSSSSTVDNYLAAAGPGAVPPVVVCIGPTTAATARQRGLDVTVAAAEQSVDGLVAALVAALPPVQ